MIVATPVLNLLIALTMVAPPVDPSTCAADDLHCSATAYAAAARRARSDVQRVEYLYIATRAYLALSKKEPGELSTRNLCKAKQLIDQALALPATELRGRVVESRRVMLSRLAENKTPCPRPKDGKKHDAPLVARAGGDADRPPELLAPTPAADLSPASPTSPAGAASPAPPTDAATSQTEVTARPEATAHDLQRRPSSEATAGMPTAQPARARTTDSRTHSEPPPGRRLLISGGVSLAAGLALTGVAAYTGARALDARRTGHESMQLEPTPENLSRNTRLEDEYRRFGPAAIVTGVAGGAAIVAAIVMLSVGARRKARADGEPTLMPVRTGLLFTVKF